MNFLKNNFVKIVILTSDSKKSHFRSKIENSYYVNFFWPISNNIIKYQPNRPRDKVFIDFFKKIVRITRIFEILTSGNFDLPQCRNQNLKKFKICIFPRLDVSYLRAKKQRSNYCGFRDHRDPHPPPGC